MKKSESLVIVAVGRDRPGLANALTKRVHALDCTIEDARMETLGGYFPILLHVSGGPDSVGKVQSVAPEWAAELGLNIEVYRDDLAEQETPKHPAYDLRVDAPERAGIIDDVTRILTGEKSNVTQLEGQMLEMPFSGEVRFVLHAIVEIPEDRLSAVRKSLEDSHVDYVLTFRH